MKIRITLSIIAWTVIASVAFGAQQQKPDQGVALTIYNNDLAVVKESRRMVFDKGVNEMKFVDVASAIDPTSINFECITAPGEISILEQNYEYDLVSADSLLKRYIDKDITVILKGSGADTGREFSGRLLAAMDGSLILKSRTGDIEIISRETVEGISLKELPDDLVTKPTLLWLVSAKEKGTQICRVTYTTGRIGWKADYSALLSADETKIDFSGWVTIDNKSGATYRDSTIKLIAGDVRRIVERPMRRTERLGIAGMKAGAPAFEEKPFMEYHLYTLSRKSTINNNQIKQIEFITPVTGVPIEKLYIYDRNQNKDKIQIKLEFENTQENHLGIALPKGKIRVFKKDPADGSLEFVGEDKIDHTPRKEKLSLYIGNAFDVVAEHTLLDSKHSRRMRSQTHKIELRNRKDKAVTVFVDEKFMAGVNWKIDKSTHEYEKRDASTARFEVKLDPDSTATIQYTTTQTW